MRRLAAIGLTLGALLSLLAGCSYLRAAHYWGTWPPRTTDVWWACPDPNAKCSPEDAALTYIQAENTYQAALKDWRGSRNYDGRVERELALAAHARSRITEPIYSGPDLIAFMNHSQRAERLALRLPGRNR